MKKILYFLGVIILILIFPFSACCSMDFARMTNEELFELRGAIKNAPEKDEKAFQLEWEKRLASMTDEEKKKYLEPEETDKEDPDKLPQPVTPARGYEDQSNQGIVIFGGMPGGKK